MLRLQLLHMLLLLLRVLLLLLRVLLLLTPVPLLLLACLRAPALSAGCLQACKQQHAAELHTISIHINNGNNGKPGPNTNI
jgi:hypothetical protein